MEKLCKKCLRIRPLGEFYRHSQMADGHLNKCKECTKSDVTENRDRNAEYYKNYDRPRYDAGHRSCPSNDNHNDYSRRWYRRNRSKKYAETVLARAVASGEVVRPGHCERCKLPTADIEAHHDDYSKPLAVRWLCTKCHGDTRRKPRHLNLAPRIRGGYRGEMKPTRAA